MQSATNSFHHIAVLHLAREFPDSCHNRDAAADATGRWMVSMHLAMLIAGWLVLSVPAPTASYDAVEQSELDELQETGVFSRSCGQEGLSVCADVCYIKGTCQGPTCEFGHPDWCPANLTDEGCRAGLTRVAVTPTVPLEDLMPDICMVMPKAGQDCGIRGKPCCLDPRAGDTSVMVRPQCKTGLFCMISDPVTSLPYGSTAHLQAVLRYPRSRGLLAAEYMGACRSTAPVQGAKASDAAGSKQAGAGGRGLNTVLGECGDGRLRCPRGTYCASNEDHMLGGARCVPLPACGGAFQQCCPPYSNGEPAILSIVDKRMAVPTCTSPDALCVWKSDLQGFDPSQNSEAVQLLSSPGSTSINVQYPDTICLPNMGRCGQAGQPCCPHAQFARSNNAMYFRLHVCDPGLKCNTTISLWKQPKGELPVLGVCQGAQQSCGRLGQHCCTHTDQAGWEWRTCEDGKPGVFCGPGDVCIRCPSATAEAGSSQASLAALHMPGLGNAC